MISEGQLCPCGRFLIVGRTRHSRLDRRPRGADLPPVPSSEVSKNSRRTRAQPSRQHMFHAASKILFLIFQPSSSAVIAIATGFVLARSQCAMTNPGVLALTRGSRRGAARHLDHRLDDCHAGFFQCRVNFGGKRMALFCIRIIWPATFCATKPILAFADRSAGSIFAHSSPQPVKPVPTRNLSPA